MSKDCLVLGVDYQPLTLVPLSVISWDKALSKVYKGNATVVEEYDDWILRSQTMTVKVPAIIALTNKRKVRHKVRLSRYNILLRDDFTCQFCGDKYHIFDNKNLTKDHVIPKSKGGPSTWNNLVAACSDCNFEKGDRNIMKPKKPAYKPDYWELAAKSDKHPIKIKHPSWALYLGRSEDKVILVGRNQALVDDESPE